MAQIVSKGRANKHGDQIQQSKSIETLDVILPLLSTSVKKVMNNMSAKVVNSIHYVASLEELSEEVLDSKVTRRSSSLAATDLTLGGFLVL